MANTALVNVDSGVAEKLCSFLSREEEGEEGKDSFCEQTREMLSQEDYSALLLAFSRRAKLLLGLENEKDTEGGFQAIAALLNMTRDRISNEKEVVESLVEVLSSGKSVLALKILVTVFNLLQSNSSKLLVLKGLLSYANKIEESSLISHFHQQVSSLISKWDVSVEDQRDIFLLVADNLFATNQDPEAVRFLTSYLSTFSNQKELSAEEVKVATKAVLCAIKSPVSLYKNRMELSKALAGRTTSDASLTKLMDLLRLFSSGTIDGYLKFHSENAALFEKYSICHDTALTSMRLLSLCALAARFSCSGSESGKVLSYKDIATALDVSTDEEVEEWVVEAISHELLEASMDQLKREITVSRCVRMSFDREEWINLQKKLSAWRNNIAGVLEVVKSRQNNQ